MSKYKNVKCVVDGIKFHSKLEADYYYQLKWLKANNMIKSFELQPKFILQEKFEKNGKKYQAITYNADFKVIGKDGSIEIIDVKGMPPTKDFLIKQKLFENKFPELTLIVLKYVKKYGGWITLDKYKEIKKREKQASKKVGE